MKIKNVYLLFLSSLFVCLSQPADSSAQLSSLRNIPIATGNQFLVFPSQNLGMGNVSIALDDTLLDPAINPAKGTRNKRTTLFSSPVYYNFSNENGSSRTIPFGAKITTKNWFMGFSMAFQEVESVKKNNISSPSMGSIGLSSSINKYTDNKYVTGIFAGKISGTNISVGGSLFWAGLEAFEGVNLHVVNNREIEQNGEMMEYRIGLLNEFKKGNALELMVSYTLLKLKYDLIFLYGHPITKVEQLGLKPELDYSDNLGFQLGYTYPLPRKFWRLGLIFSGNRKTHPEISGDESMSLSRKTGKSQGYNMGFGFSRQKKKYTIGLDIIYEPVWSNTWTIADEDKLTPNNDIIPAGDKTSDNDFRFSNKLLRLGIRREGKYIGFQSGIQLTMVSYKQDLYNRVSEIREGLEKKWTEWTASWGCNINFPEVQLRYTGYITKSGGFPTENSGLYIGYSANSGRGTDYLITPGSPLGMSNNHVFIHQFSVSYLFGK